jgi:hypothetical protein
MDFEAPGLRLIIAYKLAKAPLLLLLALYLSLEPAAGRGGTAAAGGSDGTRWAMAGSPTMRSWACASSPGAMEALWRRDALRWHVDGILRISGLFEIGGAHLVPKHGGKRWEAEGRKGKKQEVPSASNFRPTQGKPRTGA